MLKFKPYVPPSFDTPDLEAAVMTAGDAVEVLSLVSSALAHKARATKTPMVTNSFMVVVRIFAVEIRKKNL